MTLGNQNSEKDAHAQLDCAVNAGVTHIDTAEAYPVPPSPEMAGRTEKYIGSWLAKGSVKRENLVIATKVSGPGRAFLPHNRGQTHKSASSLERDQIRAAAQASIQRMGCSYLDILYLHWPERPCCNFGRTVFNPEQAASANPVPFEEQVQGMKELYDEGIIRGWALSNETAYGVTMHCEAAKKLNAPLPCTIQNDFSLVDRAFERETAEACFHYGLKMCSYGPLAGGVLSGKYSDDNADLSKARHQLFPSFQKRYHLDRTKRAAKKYAELAKENDITPSQLAIAWQRSRWYIDSIIIGATTMEQLEENIAPFTKDIQLSKDVLEKIDEIHREHKDPTNDVVYM